MSNVGSLALGRLEQLLDEHSFVELQANVTARNTDFTADAKKEPSDGVVIGHGLIDGAPVFVFAQDSSVLGGTLGEMHAKKILSVYEMALKVGAPVIGLLDCAGVRLNESFDALEAMGEVLRTASNASSMIPQIMVVCGNCGGGLSVLTGIADFTYMTDDAKLFVNSPDAISGNRSEKCDCASAEFKAEHSGSVDFVGSYDEITAKVRALVSIIPASERDFAMKEGTDDINRAAEGLYDNTDSAAAIATELADNRVFVETKAAYGKDMTTGFILMDGITVGVVGNTVVDGAAAISARGAYKAADFVEYCDTFHIPVLTITNVDGFDASLCAEKSLPRALKAMTKAFANSYVPKINLITGEAMGSSYVLMNSKSMGADLVYAFSSATIGAMDSNKAAKIICDSNSSADITEVANEYAAMQANASYAASRGYVDRLVEPQDARKYIIAGFEMLLNKVAAPVPAKRHLPFGMPFRKH